MKTNEMPKIPYVPQNSMEAEILSTITKNGHLRASMKGEKSNGEAFYVWRNVAFYISPESRHHCMPVGADFYMEGNYDQRNEKIKNVLDPLVDRIVDSVPLKERHGLLR